MNDLNKYFETEDRQQVESHYEKKKGSGLMTVLLSILLVLLVGYGGYLTYKKYKLNTEIEDTQLVIEAQQKNAIETDSQEISLAQKKVFLNEKESARILWTNVLVKFTEAIPERNKINVVNFSGNEDLNLSFAANTSIESLDPYLDTAVLIETLKNKPYFINVFIPSIASSVNESGQEALTYTLRMNYEPDQNDTELIQLTNSIPPNPDPDGSQLDPDAINSILENLKQITPETPTPNEQ